jgi:hypothetical protein
LPNLLFLTHLAKLYPSHDTHVNWKKYNESLVKRGEVLFGFDVIDNWDTEFEKMNECKRWEICISRFIYQGIGIHESILSFTIYTD